MFEHGDILLTPGEAYGDPGRVWVWDWVLDRWEFKRAIAPDQVTQIVIGRQLIDETATGKVYR